MQKRIILVPFLILYLL